MNFFVFQRRAESETLQVTQRGQVVQRTPRVQDTTMLQRGNLVRRQKSTIMNTDENGVLCALYVAIILQLRSLKASQVNLVTK
jgi:hypothetical protein